MDENLVDDNRGRTWQIGELASACGLTVRALHHYDEIGLLRPSQRSYIGHRLYDETDAARLYEIVALRGLGLHLKQVRDVLTDGVDPRILISEQLRAITAQQQAAARLREHLAAILAELDAKQHPTAADLLTLVKHTVTIDSLAANHLSADVLNRITRRHTELGSSAVSHLTAELSKLYQQVLNECNAETDPADPVVHQIVSEIDRVSAALSGHDQHVTSGVRELWAEHGERVHPGSGIPWGALVNYLEAARHLGPSAQRSKEAAE